MWQVIRKLCSWFTCQKIDFQSQTINKLTSTICYFFPWDTEVKLRILVSSFLQCKTVKKVKLEILKSFWWDCRLCTHARDFFQKKAISFTQPLEISKLLRIGYYGIWVKCKTSLLVGPVDVDGIQFIISNVCNNHSNELLRGHGLPIKLTDEQKVISEKQR